MLGTFEVKILPIQLVIAEALGFPRKGAQEGTAGPSPRRADRST